MSVEEYLDLDDQDYQYLLSINAGEVIQYPWYGSALGKKERSIRLSNELDISPEEDTLQKPKLEEIDQSTLEIPEEDIDSTES